MKILAMQGSPNVDGLTAKMAKQAVAGAGAAGAKTELLALCELKLGACRQCDDGWGQCRREGTCIIDDDFDGVRQKMAAVDGIVISTPVYWGNLSEVFKSFLDRLRRCERGAGRAQGRGQVGARHRGRGRERGRRADVPHLHGAVLLPHGPARVRPHVRHSAQRRLYAESRPRRR